MKIASPMPRSPWPITATFVPRLVAVADRAIAHQAALHRVGKVGQVGLDIDRPGREQHPPRRERSTVAPFLVHGRHEAIGLRRQSLARSRLNVRRS